MIDIVDLGTKQGGALDGFFHPKQKVNFDAKKFKRTNCLGIDINSNYEKAVKSKGYMFEAMNLASPEVIANLPKARGYLLWHFLEHLPSKEIATEVVQKVMEQSQEFVWFKLPNFDQDHKTGEGALRKLGLRFTWTDWKGHPCHWLLKDNLDAIEKSKADRYKLQYAAAKTIASTSDSRVVPINAPTDTVEYKEELGTKFTTMLMPSVVAEWDVFVYFNKG